MNHPTPEPILPVTIRRHRVDWEADDLAELTARRILSRHQKLRQGCWYLNPRFTVSCPAPTAEFFRTVLHLRSSWLRTCRQVQDKSGHRYRARQAELEGRKGALQMIDPETVTEVPHDRPGEPVLLAELPPSLRLEVLLSGHLAKQLAYSGVLFIEGDIIPARTWQVRADQLLNPVADVPVTITHRHVDLATFESTRDPEPLKAFSRSALQEHLDRHPTHAAFVTPQETISAPTATPAFYEAAKQAQARWCILLNRTLGCGNVRRLRRTADPATLCLTFSGTLLMDGQVYLPRCWPIHAPSPGRLKKTPSGSPTVPPEFLGLSPPDTVPGQRYSEAGSTHPAPTFNHPNSFHQRPSTWPSLHLSRSDQRQAAPHRGIRR